MRILYVGHFIPYPPHGGSNQRNYYLWRHLSEQFEIDMVTFTQRSFFATEQELSEAVTAMKEFCRSVEVIRVPTDYSGLGWYALLLANTLSLTPYSVWRFHSRQCTEVIRKRLSEDRYDLVYFDTIALAPFARLAGTTPCIMGHHNIESSLLLRRAAKQSGLPQKLYVYLQGRKLRRFEKTQCPRFAANITVSEIDAAELAELCPGTTIHVIPNGTDTTYFQPSEPSSQPRLVYAGGMTWFPNRDAMLFYAREIHPLIKAQVPDAKMTIIGRSPAGELVRLAEADPSLELKGWVDDIRPYLAAASVYIVPIRVGGGTRLKILDAMAAGMAVVSTAVGCEGIDVTPGENILVADTPEHLADSVVRLLRDDSYRARLSRNARRLMEQKYAWNVVGRQAVDLYHSIAKTSPGHARRDPRAD